MASNNFYVIENKEKEAIFQAIATEKGMTPFAVEKDWWVVQTLAIIFDMNVAQHLVFKGGTSLSKAWNLIERFSEDIDLAIERGFLGFKGELSKNQRTKLRKTASEYTSGKFLKALQENFVAKGLESVDFKLIDAKDSDHDPRIIEIYYPNEIEPPGYLQPKVQVEIGCRSLREPFTMRSFRSLVDDHYPNHDFAQALIRIPTVNPERTFLEKVFLLHEEFQRPKEKMRVDRLSRHLYDVVKVSKTAFATKALSDQKLYETIVEHRYKFTRVAGVNYNLHQPQGIDPVPTTAVIEEWRKDYKTMIEEMIYEQNPASFNQIITDLTQLRKQINALPWQFQTTFPNPNS